MDNVIDKPAGVDEIMITINNRQIPLSEAETTLKDMESEIKRGFNQKLQDERAEIKRLLEEDKEWLNTHDQSLWMFYEPKVDGGKGYTGNSEQLKIKPEAKVETKTDNADFNPKVALLEKEVNDLKSTLLKVQNQTFESGKDRVTVQKTELLKKYSYADSALVNARLENYFLLQGDHAPFSYIETVIKESDGHVRKIVETTKKAVKTEEPVKDTKTATPLAGGDVPVTDDKKLPPLESSAFLDRIKKRLKEG